MSQRAQVGQGRVTGRRELAVGVLLCATGSALALVAAGRTWAVEVTVRPAPLPEVVVAHSGGDLRPWLPALAWLALAGAGALPATRGNLRRVVGVLLAVAGVAIGAGAGSALTAAVATAGADGGALGWPALAAAGGLAVTGTGALTAWRSRRWPAMGTRYERTARPGRTSPEGPRQPARAGPEHLWNALDRGEDPTV